MEKQLEYMATRCWRTSASRFEAARRMRRCHNASTLCVALISVEIIVLNLLVFVDNLHLDDKAVTITTVCLSVFVLVLSLIVSQLRYEQREVNYHSCAVNLGNLEKRIRIFKAAGKPITYEILMDLNKEYNSILLISNLNHTTMDHDWAMRKDKDKDKQYGENPICLWWHRTWLAIKWYLLRSDSIYHCLTAIGGIAVIAVASICR
jgi:hypothetical protein